MTEWKDLPTFQDVACAQANGWEIQYHRQRFDDADGWYAWDQASWNNETKFRARPRQPKMKKVKLEAWLSKYDGLRWIAEGMTIADDKWTRQPHLDLEGEVPE